MSKNATQPHGSSGAGWQRWNHIRCLMRFALDANVNNDLVKLVRDLADAFDLGFFDLDEPVKRFDDPNSDVKTALFNYGIAAIVYLIAGRFLERLIRP